MNFCIISCQAILLAVLLIQNYYNETEARKHSNSAEEWYHSLQKGTGNVMGMIVKNSQKGWLLLKEKSGKMIENIQHAFGDDNKYKDTVNTGNNAQIGTDMLVRQENNIFSPEVGDDASNLSDENKKDTEEPQRIPLEKLESSKKKKRIKKNKKKKTKLKHVTAEKRRERTLERIGKHLALEQKELSGELDKEELGRRAMSKNDMKKKRRERTLERIGKHLALEQKELSGELDKEELGRRAMSKNDKKKNKGKKISTRKFVKIVQNDFNSSDSDELGRKNPVDIIVHIKMNE